MAENKLGLEFNERWPEIYWAYNVPLQMWDNEQGARPLNYMPRRERCSNLEESVSREDLPAYCRNAAKVLRNLAALFDAMAEGKIKHIYYPNKTVEEAIKDEAEDA